MNAERGSESSGRDVAAAGAEAPGCIRESEDRCHPGNAGPSGEEMLGKAIARTLQAPAQDRADLFEALTREIIAVTNAPDCGMRPWTCSVNAGTDGSRIFRGGIGYSIVIDPDGRLWRAGTYEDFETTYNITPTSCEIASMKPIYTHMKEYVAVPSKEVCCEPAV